VTSRLGTGKSLTFFTVMHSSLPSSSMALQVSATGTGSNSIFLSCKLTSYRKTFGSHIEETNITLSIKGLSKPPSGPTCHEETRGAIHRQHLPQKTKSFALSFSQSRICLVSTLVFFFRTEIRFGGFFFRRAAVYGGR
jgi:hypothetical protein